MQQSSCVNGFSHDIFESLVTHLSLESIKLDVEGIEDASSLVRCGATKLKYLSLSVHCIAPNLACFIGLKHLMILSLRDNCLTSFLGIETIHSLEVIIVDRNSLSSLAPLGEKSCRLVIVS